jgi:carboxymethylenebutenolidase
VSCSVWLFFREWQWQWQWTEKRIQVYDASVWDNFAYSDALDTRISAVVVYGTAGDRVVPASMPVLCHLVGQGKADSHPGAKVYTYPTDKASNFAIPCQPNFDSTNEAVSHTRNLTFLKKYVRGLDFDLEAIWEEHTYFEFAERSVPKTMATMVQEPYVNHIPTV